MVVALVRRTHAAHQHRLIGQQSLVPAVLVHKEEVGNVVLQVFTSSLLLLPNKKNRQRLVSGWTVGRLESE